eukprot:COSAG01_NODE_23_length_37704_cov_30.005877_23_plen_106_part_00
MARPAARPRCASASTPPIKKKIKVRFPLRFRLCIITISTDDEMGRNVGESQSLMMIKALAVLPRGRPRGGGARHGRRCGGRCVLFIGRPFWLRFTYVATVCVEKC